MMKTRLRRARENRSDATGNSVANHPVNRWISVHSAWRWWLPLGVLAVLMCVWANTLNAASSGGLAQDPEAYMRDLAERLGSDESKEMLLRGTTPSRSSPAAPQAATRKPITAKSASSPSRPTELALPRSPSGTATSRLRQPVWSQSRATGSSQQELTVINPDGSIAVGNAQKDKAPLDAATCMSVYNKAAEIGLEDIRTERLAKTNEPWTLSGDLEKYRAHAAKDGSRECGESLVKALERSGMAVTDGVNIFLLGYASDRAQAFRTNDGKGLLEDPNAVPQRAGETIGSLGQGIYSLADLITLNALPDPNSYAYTDNAPIVRPIVFAGRTVGGIWKTTEEIGNAVTWGLFDNVTGCIGLLIEDLIEVLKHTGQAVTNVARLPVRGMGQTDENGERAMDWALLVPLELVSNAVEMKGFANTMDYTTAFEEKGVIGSIVEFGGSSFILYRAVDEAADKIKDHYDKKHRKSSDSSSSSTDSNTDSGSDNSGSSSSGSNTSTGTSTVVDTVTETPEVDIEMEFTDEGLWY